MTILIEKGNPFFDYGIAQKYFYDNQLDLDDINGFESLFENSRFFNVYNHGYVGSIFVYESVDNKKYLGGYAQRKHHKDVVNAIREVSDMFDEVYAHTRHLNAVIALKKAGFVWHNREEKILVKKNIEKEK